MLERLWLWVNLSCIFILVFFEEVFFSEKYKTILIWALIVFVFNALYFFRTQSYSLIVRVIVITFYSLFLSIYIVYFWVKPILLTKILLILVCSIFPSFDYKFLEKWVLNKSKKE